MPEFIHKQFKTILNKQKYIDGWFWNRYSLNPYNGCQFGCIYCDGRSEKYRMQAGFSETIVIKDHAANMLEQRIGRARTFLPDVVGFGGVTDGYQPIEKETCNARAILEVLHKYRYPVHMVTKSTLVLRDLDLFENIANQTWAAVSVTLTTVNAEFARFLEPHAPTPGKRLEIVSRFKKEAPHVQTGFLLMPIIPGLTDNRSDLKTYLKQIQDAGADYCLFGGLTLRDRQADYFLKHVDSQYPNALKQMETLYQFQYEPDFYCGQYTVQEQYQKTVDQTVLELCDAIGMPVRMKRFIPQDYRRTNYRIAEILLNESYKRQLQQKRWSDLFWAGQHIQLLKEPIEMVASRDALSAIPNVTGDIWDFIKDMIPPAPKQTTLFD